MHLDIFSGLYTSLGKVDILLRMLKSWGKIQVKQHSSRSLCTRAARRCNTLSHSHTPERLAQMRARMCTYAELGTLTKEHVIYLCACLGVGRKFRLISTDREACAQEQQMVQYPLSRSHAGDACANARTHMDIFKAMYTNLGTCDLLVRMLRRWGKMQVNQHRWRSLCTRASEGAILSLTLTRRDARSNACTHMHIFRGMYTNLGIFDLLLRMLRSWGKIQVNQHSSRSLCTRAEKLFQHLANR